MSQRKAAVLITLAWTAAGAACCLLTVWPAFRHLFGLEAFPLGCAAGWLAHAGAVARRRR